MRLGYYFFRFGLGCFAILSAGSYVFDVSPALAQSVTSAKTISISMQPQTPISTLMYGANYEWADTTASQFPSWIYGLTGYAAQPSAPVSLFRYPGGWMGEWYNWVTNQMNAGGPVYTEAGEPPDEFLEYVQPMAIGMAIGMNPRAASFMLATRDVITTKTPAEIPALITQQVATYLSILSLYHNNIKYWEIGNEWWLQNGGNSSSPLSTNALLTSNLSRYAALVAAAAPVLKAAYPNIKLYVTADWTTAGGLAINDQFAQLRKLVGPAAWALIDGVSIHSYCGTTVAISLCTALPQQVASIIQDTGKSDIYASEWDVGARQTTNDFGIQNASATVSALQDMAMAGITKAAYWPSVGLAADNSLIIGTSLTATGVVFRAMSLLYEGEALPTHVAITSGAAGQTVAVAAENNVRGKTGMAVIIPTNGDGTEMINLSLAGTGMTKVVSSSVMYSRNYESGYSATTSSVVPLRTSLVHEPDGSVAAQFVLNPGIVGRGSNWEIAFLQLQ